MVRVAGKFCVARISLSLLTSLRISVSIINAKCAPRHRRKSVIAVKGRHDIRTRISPIPLVYASLRSESLISVYDSFTRSLCGLSYWIYSYYHIGYTRLRPTNTHIPVAGHGLRDREIPIEVSVLYIRLYRYIHSRSLLRLRREDRCEIPKRVTVCRAPSRLSLSRSAAILLFVVFATLGERVYGAETYLSARA